MAKKYLALEEAASILGMAPDELVRLRERGQIRGFADRGTWKFKSEDVEEFARVRQPDSSPDVRILDDSPQDRTPTGVEIAKDPRKGSGGGRVSKMSDSDVRLLLDDALVPGGTDSTPEVVLTPMAGDSDVRLNEDAHGLIDSGSDSDVKLINTSSSDVKLVGASSPAKKDPASDSDVQLVPPQSDSDVRLALPSASGTDFDATDSDVRLVGTDDLVTLSSDSDIRLAGAKGAGKGGAAPRIPNVKLAESDDNPLLLNDDSGIALDAGSATKTTGGSSSSESGSGITLQSFADSGISLEKADSGISLVSPLDSGIALDKDSGIALDNDSGIALDAGTDSGISLAGDSGIALADSSPSLAKGKKGKAPQKDKGKGGRDVDRTVPMLKMVDNAEADATEVEVPTLSEEEDSAYKLTAERPDTNVVLFAEDDESGPLAEAASKGKGKGKSRVVDDSFALEEGSSVEFSEADDFSDDDDLEVAEDVLADEGDLDEIDVFEPAEEDFDSSVQAGESHAEFAAPVQLRASGAAPEAEWDGLTVAGVALSSVALLLTGVVMFDLVRTMWYWDQNVVVGGALLDLVRGMF
jgi:hypothetical protein